MARQTILFYQFPGFYEASEFARQVMNRFDFDTSTSERVGDDPNEAGVKVVLPFNDRVAERFTDDLQSLCEAQNGVSLDAPPLVF